MNLLVLDTFGRTLHRRGNAVSPRIVKPAYKIGCGNSTQLQMKRNVCHSGPPFIITMMTVFCLLLKIYGQDSMFIIFDPVFKGAKNVE